MTFCTKCGGEIKAGAKFCTSCGATIEVKKPVEKLLKEQPKEPMKEVPEKPTPQVTPSPPPSKPVQPTYVAPPKPKSKLPMYVGVIAVIAILIIASFYVGFMMGGEDTTDLKLRYRRQPYLYLMKLILT